MAKRPALDHSIPLGMDDELANELDALDPGGITQSDALRAEEALMDEMLGKLDSILPDIPAPPGFHLCWLSMTHERDFIGQRERWGYTPYRISEAPPDAYIPSDVQTSAANADGLIRVREMVLYKIPTIRAEAIMQIHHHRRPNEMAAGLDPRRNAALSTIKDKSGTPLIKADGEGLGEYTTPRAAPVFFRDTAPHKQHRF